MRRYYRTSNKRRVVAVSIALILVLAGLAFTGYSLLIRDPLGAAAIFGFDAPENPTMTLTVPKMARIDEVPVYNAAVDDTGALHDGTLHVNSTGFPWQSGANVYIAGHRLGFPATKSYLVFWDLDKLGNGDEVILTDANGTRYTYSVFNEFIVNSGAVQVMEPMPGRSIVSLQTCTLPDYSQRLIVQAELVSVV